MVLTAFSDLHLDTNAGNKEAFNEACLNALVALLRNNDFISSFVKMALDPDIVEIHLVCGACTDVTKAIGVDMNVVHAATAHASRFVAYSVEVQTASSK